MSTVTIRTLGGALLFTVLGLAAQPPVQFVFTSDVHFGIATKGSFQGSPGPVPALVVNRQAVKAMNRLPALVAPQDQGVNAGRPLGDLDFLVITGDLANRQEAGPPAIQSAAASWAQFQATYGEGLTLKDRAGRPLPRYLTPGNHDVSNAIGYPVPLVPATDATALVNIFNAAHPASPITTATFAYDRHKVFFTKDAGGIHFVFLNMWPDSDMRSRIDADLRGREAPVILFMHMPPDPDPRNFRDPASRGNAFVFSHGFQNLLSDPPGPEALDAQGNLVKGAKETRAARELADFLLAHRTIVAWFHGHENWHEAYTWNGGAAGLALPVFRVDSPMKGRVSSRDERRLSFQVVSIDPGRKLMTVRECLWNATGVPDGPSAWGASATISLEVPRRSDARGGLP